MVTDMTNATVARSERPLYVDDTPALQNKYPDARKKKKKDSTRRSAARWVISVFSCHSRRTGVLCPSHSFDKSPYPTRAFPVREHREITLDAFIMCNISVAPLPVPRVWFVLHLSKVTLSQWSGSSTTPDQTCYLFLGNSTKIAHSHQRRGVGVETVPRGEKPKHCP